MGGYYESYYPEQHYSGITLIAVGAAEAVFARGQEIRMVANSALEHPWMNEVFFHECSELSTSSTYMLCQLPQTARKAVLAFGVREAGRFQEGQGTELLRFLADATALKLDQLLYEQAGLL